MWRLCADEAAGASIASIHAGASVLSPAVQGAAHQWRAEEATACALDSVHAVRRTLPTNDTLHPVKFAGPYPVDVKTMTLGGAHGDAGGVVLLLLLMVVVVVVVVVVTT